MSDELVKRIRQYHAEITEDDGGESGEMAMFREAADRIEALMAERQWQPIKTAPKDGMTVLLWVPYATPSVSVGYFVYELWFNDGGRPTSPTHWMPLPAPPAEPQK